MAVGQLPQVPGWIGNHHAVKERSAGTCSSRRGKRTASCARTRPPDLCFQQRQDGRTRGVRFWGTEGGVATRAWALKGRKRRLERPHPANAPGGARGARCTTCWARRGFPVVLQSRVDRAGQRHKDLLNRGHGSDKRVRFARFSEEGLVHLDVVAVTTPWNEFRSSSPPLLKRSGRRPTQLGRWGILDRQVFQPMAA